MKDISHLSLETGCVHAGLKDSPEGAVITPIFQTSTFKFKDVDHGARLFKGEEQGYIYTRMRNPTVEAMEDSIAFLEGGAKALGCGSGMAAVHTLIAAVCGSGDHIVCSESVYGATATLLASVMPRFGVETTFVDTSDLAAIEAAFKPNTKLLYLETPGNPTLSICDIEEAAKLAKARGVKVAVDNTFMSPIYQRPFELGADYIIHSLTKFINGHADVVAGAIVIKDIEEYPHFRRMLNHFGGTIDPFNSFLVHRGIKTLKLRVVEAARNAQIIAEYLEKHPKVEWVLYPGLKSHPQYAISQKQSSGPGSMIACELKGGLEAGKTLMNNVEIWGLAVSLGGVESLIQHPASMTHAGMGKEAREQAKITDGLVRISVGIENAEELIAGLEKGLSLI